MNKYVFTALVSLFLVSCQKEIDWGLNQDADGDLLVKTVQITQETNDTNVITYQYDVNKHLIAYQSAGKINGIATNISYTITRSADGKITRLVSKTATPGIDSIVYFPSYDGDRIAYYIDSIYATFLDAKDSTVLTYNSFGFCTEIEQFADLFGTMEKMSKRTFVYDATGNPISEKTFGPDGLGGYELMDDAVYTYNDKKPAIKMGDEGLLVFSISSRANNDLTREEHDFVIGAERLTTITGQQYNAFNRPRQHAMAVVLPAPGYNVKLVHSYQ